MPASPLVSCLCITRNRVSLLRRAIACFLAQTYQPRELLVLHDAEDDDPETYNYLSALNEPSVRTIKTASHTQPTLGELRNLSLQMAQGHYIAQWDDDDWYAPTRLAHQIAAIRSSERKGCVLAREIIFDTATQSAFVSAKRAWEGSLVAERSAVPAYADLRRGEDTPVIKAMLEAGNLVFLDAPQLYVYVYHGNNTWDSAHWQNNLLKYATLLPAPITKQIAQSLKM